MRYVYAMRKKKKCLWAKCTGQEEIKIGIAKNAKERNRQVNAAIKSSEIELLWAYKVPHARSVEKELHKTFSTSRYTMRKAGKGAGKTEWFFLNWCERVELEFLIQYYRFVYWIYVLIPVAIYLYLIYFHE